MAYEVKLFCEFSLIYKRAGDEDNGMFVSEYGGNDMGKALGQWFPEKLPHFDGCSLLSHRVINKSFVLLFLLGSVFSPAFSRI